MSPNGLRVGPPRGGNFERRAAQARKAEADFIARDPDGGPGQVPATLAKSPRMWVHRWRQRWGVALRVVAKLSELSDAVVSDRVDSFWSYCKHVVAAHADAVWVNFDETPLWYNQSTGRTNIRRRRLRGRHPVRLVGACSLSRKRITVGLTISTDDALASAVPVFVVFKGATDSRPNTPTWAGVDIPERLSVHWQKRAWMSEDLALEYVALLIQERDRLYGSDRAVVLVWDSFRGHLTAALKALCADNNVIMVVIPRGLTSILQGLDTHVNKAFKAACRRWWRSFMFTEEDPRAGVLRTQ